MTMIYLARICDLKEIKPQVHHEVINDIVVWKAIASKESNAKRGLTISSPTSDRK